ncbi:MAG: 1-deoxy-D-xylulose-5-phosphate reductoisomerase, partial [Acidimicrobiales bacterium]
LCAQARAFSPRVVAIGDARRARELASELPAGTELRAGPDAIESLGNLGDVVVNGVVGFAGLAVTVEALRSGRRLALANKESLIAGAPVVQVARATSGAEIVPVDSEHCAIHQCLSVVGGRSVLPDPHPAVERLLVTASGGPFRGRTRAELAGVKIEDALAHPTWDMGPKITIDSSTLMNKGLEVIEAHELFGLPYDRIDVVVHPQSVVHSMVELVDGSTIAQLSCPDMRLPIGYAMGWPARLGHAFGAIDWSGPLSLSFEPPDRESFPCLDLAFRAGREGGPAPAWLNAANEVAVAAFLEGRLGWLSIATVVASTLEKCDGAPLDTVDDVLEADRRARELASGAVERTWAAV